MREFIATVSRSGQITLPIELRRILQIGPGDRIVFVVDGADSARLRRADHDVHSVRGLIPTPPGLITGDFDDLIDEAMADHADTRMRGERDLRP
ncbi:MAG: AbrB/MazE/SpoVT family DNA-binding domain-containing protein [Thermomicrobiales bacterium]|nr:AbrB/MazE/SpoVT family DNA-binding domain-containing protein [Thermomicrobiales bacterium]